jgi:hypothetical protein
MASDISKLLMVVFGIQLVLVIFGFTDIPGNAMYTFLQNPTAWDSTLFMSFITDLLTLASIGAIVVGSLVIGKSDLLIFAGLIGLFVSFGIGLAGLFSVIEASSSTVVAMLFVSPIIIIYLVACLKAWRGLA